MKIFSLSPEFGYNIDKVIAIGATMGIGYSNDEVDELTQYEIAPYIRTTFAQTKSVKIFAEGALFLTYSKYDLDANDYSLNTWGAEIRPGMLVNVSNNVQLQARATMLQYSKADNNNINIKTWKIGIPNNFTVGVLFNF